MGKNLDDVQKKLKNGTYKLATSSTIKECNSDVWKTFSKVANSDDGKILDYAACNVCSQLYMHTFTGGTSAMRRHKCNLSTSSNLPKINAHFTVSSVNLIETKKAFTQACAKFIAKDIRPYNIVAGQGFHDLIQAAIEIGARKGRIDASEIIPHRSTVTAHARALAETARLKLQSLLNSEIVDGYCAMTTDMWTDDYRKISYLALTIHFIDNNWNLQERVLATKKFDDRHTAINIRAEILECVKNFGFSSLEKIIFVTDRGPNIVASF